MKKILLVEDLDSTEKKLQKKFGSYDFYPAKNKDTYVYTDENASYVLEIYNSKKLKNLQLLFIISNFEEMNIPEEFACLQDVSKDKRYSKKYLKEFGNPKKYEFNLEDIYTRCESIGLANMELNFSKAMTCSQVLKVVSYRLTQLLKLSLDKEEEASEYLEDLSGIFMLGRGVFEKNIMKKMTNLVLNKAYFISEARVQEEYFLNFEAFAYDTSGFYEAKKSNEAIYYCLKKTIYEALENRSRKEIKMIDIAIKYFASLFSKEELEFISMQSNVCSLK